MSYRADVLPTSPIFWPTFTVAPAATERVFRWAYRVCQPPP